MRLAIIRDGVVENVIEAEEGFSAGDGTRTLPAGSAAPGWIFDGVKFLPPKESAATPRVASMFQAREALRRTPAAGGGNLLDAVNAHIEAKREEQPTLALAWEYATEVERDGVFVNALAGDFGLDDATLDELFRHAATIHA